MSTEHYVLRVRNTVIDNLKSESFRDVQEKEREILCDMTMYMRRGKKYFFRGVAGKIAVELNELRPELKYGVVCKIKMNQELKHLA